MVSIDQLDQLLVQYWDWASSYVQRDLWLSLAIFIASLVLMSSIVRIGRYMRQLWK